MATADGGTNAVVNVFRRTVEVLMDRGQYEALKVVISNFEGNNFFLHRALVAQQENIAKVLVESGADVNYYHETRTWLRDYEEGCAHYSCYLPLQLSLFCSLDMTRFLLKSGADVNKQNSLKETTFRFACGTSVGADRVAFLLENGAKVHCKDKNKVTGLHSAVVAGNIETVTLLINYGADMEAKDVYGCTPLMWACRNSVGVACLKTLLEKGADCRAVSITGETALHEAAKSGHSLALKLLIRYGAQLEARTYDGDTALILACGAFVPAECVKVLLENGAFPNVKNREMTTPLNLAIEARNVKKIEMLFQYGATKEDKVDQGKTYLIQACGKPQNARAVSSLLQKNASPNVKNQLGETALHQATRRGDIKTLKLKADVNAMNDHGETPLMLVCTVSPPNAKCVEFLLRNKILPNVTDISGDTALHRTLRLGNIELSKILVKGGADVNARDGNKQTPLMLACKDWRETSSFSWNDWRKSSELIKLLVEHGADLEARTSKGETPFLTAVQTGSRHLRDLLYDLGADVCAEDKEGRNAIMLAMETAHRNNKTYDLGFFQYWIDKGVSVNHRDKNGWTPLMLAAKYKQVESLKRILKAGADVHAVRTEETERGENEMTALSILLEETGWERSGCAEELIRHGAADSLPERCNASLH